MATVALGRRGSVVARATTDRELLRSFLERDRLYAAYALCDLEDREFGRTRWGVAQQGDEVVAVALEYSGMTPQPVFLMGEPDGLDAILRDVIRPRAAYLAALPELLSTVEHHYRVDPGPPMVRMWVDRTTFRPYPATVQRLLPSEIGDLNRLYQLGFAAWLPSSAIAEGVYYGIRVNGTLVAAAGTHVISERAGLGVGELPQFGPAAKAAYDAARDGELVPHARTDIAWKPPAIPNRSPKSEDSNIHG